MGTPFRLMHNHTSLTPESRLFFCQHFTHTASSNKSFDADEAEMIENLF